MRSIWLVARKEFLDCLQSRWLLSGGLLFAILALAVFYGTAAIGGSFAYPPAFGRHEFTCEPHGLFAAASGDTSELRRVCGRTRRRHADFDAHLSGDANGVFTW